MRECSFGEEAADRRLILLLMVRQIWKVLLLGLAGAILFSVIFTAYERKKQENYKIKAEGTIQIEYAYLEKYGVGFSYLNAETWNVLIASDESISFIQDQLKESGIKPSAEEITQAVKLLTPADYRILCCEVRWREKEKALSLCEAVLHSVVEIGGKQDAIKDIRIITMPKEVRETGIDPELSDIALLGALVGIFVGFVLVWAYAVRDDSIYVPATLEKRYGIPAMGSLSMVEFPENLGVLFENKKRIALLPIGDRLQKQDMEKLQKEIMTIVKEKKGMEFPVWKCFENPAQHPELVGELRQEEAILLVTEAGGKNGRKIERSLAFLKLQKIIPTGFMLYPEDLWLLKTYYKERKQRKKTE